MHALTQGPEPWRLEIVDGDLQLLHGSGHASRPEAEAAAAEWVRWHPAADGMAFLVDDRERRDDVAAAASLEGELPLAWVDLEGYGAAARRHLAGRHG